MLLVDGRIQVGKKDFLAALKGRNKTMFGQDKTIKDSRSYGPWKQIFKTVIGRRVEPWNLKGNLV
jgi:hypothetical protein